MDVVLYILINFCFIGLGISTEAVQVSETDDEDLVGGSGDEEGSADYDYQVEVSMHPVSTEKSTTTKRAIYRISLDIGRTWSPALDRSTSSIFKMYQQELKGELQRVLDLSVEELHVIQFENVNDSAFVRCVFDLGLAMNNSRPTQKDVTEKFSSHLDVGRIGNLRVRRNSFSVKNLSLGLGGECSDTEIKCLNGSCISILSRCDGVDDCGAEDSSDEQGCLDGHNSIPCLANYHRCGDGTCISEAFICDTTPDCPDKSDEENCNKNPCDKWHCSHNAECRIINGVGNCLCKTGFTGSAVGASGCLDINECDHSPCAKGELCQNKPGKFTCENRKYSESGQYIATKHCNKIKTVPKREECLEDLKNNLSSSDLNSDAVVTVLNIIEEAIDEDDDSCTSNTGYDILQTSKLANDVTFNAKENTTKSDWVKITNAVLNVFGGLIVKQCQWKNLKEDIRTIVFTEFLELLDSASLNLAEKILNHKIATKVFYPMGNNNNTKSNIVVHLGTLEKMEDNFTGSDIYADDQVYSSLSSIAVQINPEQRNHLNLQSQLSYSVLIRPIYVESIINNTVKRTDENGTDQYIHSKEFNGKLISIVFNKSIQLKSPKVRIQFAHTSEAVGYTKNVYRRKLHDGEQKKAVGGSSICAYWDTDNKIWSTLGCHKNKSLSNSLMTICECNHATAFSILASFHEYSGKDFGLQILTWILCTLSIVCLFLSLTTFALVKQTRNAERKITIHLCVALIGGNIFLIFGDKDNFHLSNATCTVFGVLTHFAWLSAFGWMAVEGIHLYIQVVRVFPPTTNHLFKIYCSIGYGIPLIIVAITSAIGFSSDTENIYVGVMFCWLQGQYILAFMAPALLICVSNMLVLITAVRIARNRKITAARKGAANIKSESNRKLIKGTISLTVILGLSWIFGILTLVDVDGHIFFAYMFTIFNASQGISIFIFRCCLNKQLRLAISGLLTQAMPSFSSKDTEKSEMNNESVNRSRNQKHQTTET